MVDRIVRDFGRAWVDGVVCVVAVGVDSGLARIQAITVSGCCGRRAAEGIQVAVDEARDRVEAVAVLVDRIVRDFGRAGVDRVVRVVAVRIDGGLARVQAVTIGRGRSRRTAEGIQVAVDEAGDRVESIAVLVDRSSGTSVAPG